MNAVEPDVRRNVREPEECVCPNTYEEIHNIMRQEGMLGSNRMGGFVMGEASATCPYKLIEQLGDDQVTGIVTSYNKTYDVDIEAMVATWDPQRPSKRSRISNDQVSGNITAADWRPLRALPLHASLGAQGGTLAPPKCPPELILFSRAISDDGYPARVHELMDGLQEALDGLNEPRANMSPLKVRFVFGEGEFSKVASRETVLCQ